MVNNHLVYVRVMLSALDAFDCYESSRIVGNTYNISDCNLVRTSSKALDIKYTNALSNIEQIGSAPTAMLSKVVTRQSVIAELRQQLQVKITRSE
jgi:hypothetical protein